MVLSTGVACRLWMGCSQWVVAGVAALDVVDGAGSAASGVRGCCPVTLVARAAMSWCSCSASGWVPRRSVRLFVEDCCPGLALCALSTRSDPWLVRWFVLSAMRVVGGVWDLGKPLADGGGHDDDGASGGGPLL